MKISSAALKNKCAFRGFSGVVLMNRVYAFRIYFDEEMQTQIKIDQLSLMKKISPEVIILKAILENQIQDNSKNIYAICERYRKTLEPEIVTILKKEIEKYKIKSCLLD